MKVLAFDAKRAFCNSSGLGNYSRTLLDSLVRYYPEYEYHLFTPKDKGLFKPLPKGNISIHKSPASPLAPIWRQFGIAPLVRKKAADIYHGLSHELPIGHMKKTKLVVTVHDLIFLSHPHLYSNVDRYTYKLKLKHAFDKADAIVAISSFTANRIGELFPTGLPPIHVISQSCDSRYFSDIYSDPPPMEIPKDYLLYVGTIEERKDLVTLIKALKESSSPIPLVIVGRETKYANIVRDTIKANGLENRVHFAGQVPFSQLKGLYKEARVLISPSIIEGWGLPVAEAICCGTPVITTGGTAMAEVAGDAGLYFEAGNAVQLASRIEEVLSSVQVREKMQSAAKIKSEEFRPEYSASMHMNLYRKLSGN